MNVGNYPDHPARARGRNRSATSSKIGFSAGFKGASVGSVLDARQYFWTQGIYARIVGL